MRLLIQVILCLTLSIANAQTLTVFAASSLRDAFTDIGLAFEQKHKNASIIFQFAGSAILATQIEQGAPADVFASANQDLIDNLELSAESAVFTHNSLAILSSSESLKTIDDLSLNDYFLVLGNTTVPIGIYTQELLESLEQSNTAKDKTSILQNVVSFENNVKQIMTKLLLAEADVGIVYKTDVFALDNPNLIEISIPEGLNPQASYAIVPIPESAQADLAQQFIDFVMNEGQIILKEHGFDTLSSP